jgi:hypothetical protein
LNPEETCRSERVFDDQLHQARRCGCDNTPKIGVVHMPIYSRRPVELRVIEAVESFDPELKGIGFGQAESLLDSEVEVLNSRTIERAALGIA